MAALASGVCAPSAPPSTYGINALRQGRRIPVSLFLSCRAFPSLKSRANLAAFEPFGSAGSEPSIHDDGLLDPELCLPGTEMGGSIEGTGVQLLYGPYMDHLWATLKQRVPGLQSVLLAPDIRVQKARKARIHNWLLRSTKLRRIRLTYFDGGAAGQAFNSLLYPDYRFDLPLLGIDLLSFGSNKILWVVDFQPLSQDSEYLERHTHELAPVHARFEQLCGKMSSRYFDENQFFSKHLIFHRSDQGAKDPALQVPNGSLWEVYVTYVDIYLKALHAAQPTADPAKMAFVEERQNAYDQYNAERDPAIKLFNTYFGSEWSKQYTQTFLFPGANL